MGGLARMSDEELLGRLVGVNIIITTKERQARKHHKRRINKKWLKRYGTIKYEVQNDFNVIHEGNTMYVTQKGYEYLRRKFGCL